MKYAFFIDIDGTLTSSKGIPQKNKDAISRARKEGHLIFINTGRSLAFIPRFVLAETELDGLVAGSGTYCSLHGEILKAGKIPLELLEPATDFLIGKKRRFMLEGENLILFHGHKIERDGFYEINSSGEIESKYPFAIIEKINISGTLDEDENAFLSKLFTTLRHSDYAECSLFGCDKGNGMRLISERIGGDFKTVAIGDSINDIDMLKAADISVAMGNSSEDLKSMCDIVTSSNEDGGVGEAIEKIIKESL